MLNWGIQLLIDDRIDAVLFNLNGVLVDTEALHLVCWKQAFDEVAARERYRNFPVHRPEPFGSDDYRRFLKGRDRYEGALSYLRHRRSTLPRGAPSDPPGNDTVCALANLKALRFRASLALRPPKLRDGALELARDLSARGYRLGLVSSSMSSEWIVRLLGIGELFPVRMDAALADDLGLAACPAPTRLTETARRLGARPSRTAVLDDSTLGVRAARAGRFGWTIGVDGGRDCAELRAAGADVVIGSLRELQPPLDLMLPGATRPRIPLPAV
jgi:alpha,alpha-trehalase